MKISLTCPQHQQLSGLLYCTEERDLTWISDTNQQSQKLSVHWNMNGSLKITSNRMLKNVKFQSNFFIEEVWSLSQRYYRQPQNTLTLCLSSRFHFVSNVSSASKRRKFGKEVHRDCRSFKTRWKSRTWRAHSVQKSLQKLQIFCFLMAAFSFKVNVRRSFNLF